MLPKYFSYYNYKITQNIDIPILFYKKICLGFPGLLSLHCRQKNCHVTYR